MKKLRSRLVIVTMVAMLGLIGFGNMGDTLAGNTRDVDWSFALSVNNSNIQKLTKREKLDDSKIYVYWISSYGGDLSKISVSPYGAHYMDGGSYAAGTRSGGEITYVMNSPKKYSLTNYVYELEYEYATVGMKGILGSGTAVGKWSPDSSGTYTVLQ